MKNIFLVILLLANIIIAQTLPFTENFNSNNLANWDIVDDEPQEHNLDGFLYRIDEGIEKRNLSKVCLQKMKRF